MNSLFLHSQRKSGGFTLIEVLFTIVLGAVLLVTFMGSFGQLLKTHKKNEVLREMQRSARFVMTRVTDRVRAYEIDYGAYDSGDCRPPANINQKLCLKGGEVIAFKNKSIMLNGQPLISGKTFEISQVHFNVDPKKDPKKNIGDLSVQTQPKVQIFLEINSKDNPSLKIPIQTTISSRRY